jgi:spore maturation protein CgeB
VTNSIRKLLILDGIGGVPLGREIRDAIAAQGIDATHFDCLHQQRRPFYTLRSAFAKANNRHEDRDGFTLLPRLNEQQLEDLLANERPSHILVIGFAYKFFAPAFLRRCADRHGIRLFLYDTDSCNLYGKRREFIFFIEHELPVYDRILSFSRVTTRFFRDTRGLDAVHMPYGAMPIEMPTERPASEVLFVGSGDLRRIFLLEAIRDHVTVRGNRWQRNLPLISPPLRERIIDEPVWGRDLHAMLGGAKIVLNITRADFFGAETGVNLRIFETLAAGAFLLTDHCGEIAELFRTGEEIETFHSSAELADKVRYYLGNPVAREAITAADHAAFRARHTWSARIENQLLPAMAG